METPEKTELQKNTTATAAPAEAVPAAPEGEEVHLREYIAVIKRRKGVILLVAALVISLAALFSAQPTRVYKATAQIVIERQLYPVTNTEERNNWDMLDEAFYETQHTLLNNRGVALAVVRELGPEQLFPPGPEQTQSFFGWVRGLLPRQEAVPPVGAADQTTVEEEQWVDAYLGSLTIKPVKNTRLVDIGFVSHSPEIAARAANAHARAFIERNIQMKLTAAQQGLKWLTTQVAEQKAKVEVSQAAVQKYLNSQNVISFEERQNIVSQKLMELNSDLTRAKNERIARQAIAEQMSNVDFEGAKIYSLPEVAQDSIILGLRNQIIQLKSRQVELSSNFGPKHPKIIEVSTRIEELEAEKNKEILRLQGTIKAEMNRARGYETSLQKALEDQKKQAQELSTKAADYNVLVQEVRSNQDAYDILLRQAKEMQLASGLESGNVKLVDVAKVPRGPVGSQRTRTMALAVFVSLFMGLGLAFFLEYMDQTVKSSDDVKVKIRLPVLGMVPHYQSAKKDKDAALFWDDPKLKKKTQPVSDYYYYYGVNSANRLIQHLQWRVQQDGGRVFAVVSSGAGEGKTTVLANAAKILALRGLRVLALDADTHHPSLHRMFGFKTSGGGLMEVMRQVLSLDDAAGNRAPGGPVDAPIAERLNRLAGGRVLEDEILANVIVVGENLSLLPAGVGKAELSGVFSFALLGKILELLRKRFDVILLDTPPLLEVAEAGPLASLSDGAVFVIRAGQVPTKSIGEAVENLKEHGAIILGAVLNDFKQ